MQHGSLAMVSHKEAPDVWQFRWSEKDLHGIRVQWKRVIGSVERYPSEAAARSALTVLLAEINSNKVRMGSRSITMAQLCDHFEQRELARDNTWRPFFSIMPADTSCSTAIRSIWFVRVQSARRAPTVLMPAEIKALVDKLAIRERTLVLLAVSTGLRQSELFGLQWGDLDFAQKTMNVTRSIVYGVVGPCKTEASQKPVPVHPTVLKALIEWRRVCRYNKSDDWVFASRRHRGRTPSWGQAILRRYIRPLAQRAGIQKRFGWHTFRHTYSTLLRSVGTEFKVMQELLRHSTLRSTLDVYTQALAPAKHAAQAAIFSLVFSGEANGTPQPSGSNDAAG
jgi:integrase